MVFQGNNLKEVVNIQVSELEAEEIAYVKLHAKTWGQPFALTGPPTGTDLDASKAEGALRGHKTKLRGSSSVKVSCQVK